MPEDQSLFDEEDAIPIWIVQRYTGTITLRDVPREDLPEYRQVLAQSEGQWVRAYQLLPRTP